MGLIKSLADNSNSSSLANRLRRRRFKFFQDLLAPLPRPLKILDIGGTVRFWEQMEFMAEADVAISILNVQEVELEYQASIEGGTTFQTVLGDARSMPQYREGEFDVVFSNSVLEHVGDFQDQRAMLNEALRVGKRFFIQTPNFYFPIEPHFHVLGFQFLPIEARVWLLQRYDLGWTAKVPDRAEAETVVRSVSLLTAKQLERLCPTAKLYRERSFGFTKSFILYGGF